MTIASEIQRIQTNISNAYSALEGKGATMPVTENSANLADTVLTIPSGGGTIVAGTNFTGSNITKDDKVWINSYHYTSGTESSALKETYGYQSHYMPDGIHYYSGSYGRYYEVGNDTSLGTLSYYGSPSLMGNCFRCPDGVVYSKNYQGMQRVDSGIGWTSTNYIPIYNTSNWVIDKTNNAIVHIDSSDGTAIKSLTLTNCSFTSASSFHYFYIGTNKIIGACSLSGTTTFAEFTLDEENSTFTVTSHGSLSTILQYDCWGITSDGKYIIGNGINDNVIYDISNLDSPQNVYASGIFPIPIPKSSVYCSYNPQNDIFTTTGKDGNNMAQVSAGLSKTIHYDKTTQTFIEIAMDYETLIGSGNSYFLGVCGTANSLTEFIYQLNSANSTKIKYLQDIEGVNLVKYSSSTITQDSQTGIADENISVGATGNVKVGAVIILPSA